MIDFIKAISCSGMTHNSTKQRLAISASFQYLSKGNPKKVHKSDFFNYFVFGSKYLSWVIEFQDNQIIILIYIMKPCIIMPTVQHTGDIWKRRMKQYEKPSDTGYYSNHQGNKLSKVDFTLKNFMTPFYGWVSTASRLEPLRRGSLLFTTKFPEIPHTHFINLGRMKG